MGQYFYTVNLDKKQYLHPHKFGSGLKLMEFSSDACGVPQALCLLLSTATTKDYGLLGSWAGDKIVVVGDYAAGVYDEFYDEVKTTHQDISDAVINEIKECYKWHPLHQLDMTSDGVRKYRKTREQK